MSMPRWNRSAIPQGLRSSLQANVKVSNSVSGDETEHKNAPVNNYSYYRSEPKTGPSRDSNAGPLPIARITLRKYHTSRPHGRILDGIVNLAITYITMTGGRGQATDMAGPQETCALGKYHSFKLNHREYPRPKNISLLRTKPCIIENTRGYNQQ